MAWVVLQIIVLTIQQSEPRFFLTKSCKKRLIRNYFDYEVTFMEEADNSENSLVSANSRIDFNSRMISLTTKECAICLQTISESPDMESPKPNSFMKTPCGHVFHKKCLLALMEHRLQCPICRSPIPRFIELDE